MLKKKRNVLKAQGHCYGCLGQKHSIKNWESKQKCSCGSTHNKTICVKNNLSRNVNCCDNFFKSIHNFK